MGGGVRKVMYGGEMRSRRTSTHVNTPGRLQARSGFKLPTANVPLRALEDGVQKIEVRATFFAISRFGLTAI